MNDIFVNEDISKPENRLNLALFHLQMDIDFHEWFCNKLGIPVSSVIYPTQNLNGNRPDYIIKNGAKIIGYIEVELGSENTIQLAAYRARYENTQTKIYSITGQPDSRNDLSLSEICSYFQQRIQSISNPQTALSANYLINLIESYSNDSAVQTRNAVSEDVLQKPFVRKLFEGLKEYNPMPNQSKAVPGRFYCDTVSEKGFSFRVYSVESTLATKSVSLLSISGGRDYITFLSAEKYRKYLNHKNRTDIEIWISFIVDVLQLPIHTISFNGRLNAPIEKVELNFDEMIDCIKPLI